jgi:tetratricopeptide (TPR) repeat protein
VIATRGVSKNSRVPFALAFANTASTLKREPGSAQFHGTLGAVYYRAGRFQDAVRSLEKAVSIDGPSNLPNQWSAYTTFFLAMSHYRQGRATEATQRLSRAYDATCDSLDGPGTDPVWNRRLTLSLLRDEAESLIK